MTLRVFSKLNDSMILFYKRACFSKDLWRSSSPACCSTQGQLGQVAHVQLGFESFHGENLLAYASICTQKNMLALHILIVHASILKIQIKIKNSGKNSSLPGS